MACHHIPSVTCDECRRAREPFQSQLPPGVVELLPNHPRCSDTCRCGAKFEGPVEQHKVWLGAHGTCRMNDK